MSANAVTLGLKPYPMERLAQIKKDLIARKQEVFDFGTGDPDIPLDPRIRQTLIDAVPPVSQYPTIRGSDELLRAQKSYMNRRFGIDPETMAFLPSFGSKEAIFHVAQSIIGRCGGKTRLVYPDPGYPVYLTSTLFAKGTPHPVVLSEENNYQLRPWDLPSSVQKETAAVWINYPHNPTAATATKEYFEKLVDWAHETDTLILSDDCYVDIYDQKYDQLLEKGVDKRPITPLMISSKKIVGFYSLSKRSGMTGMRAGFMVGDREFLEAHVKARANFGTAIPSFIQKAATFAWGEDRHVVDRRKIFTERMNLGAPALIEMGLMKHIPDTTFYLWAKVPHKYKGDDVKFALDLASKGVLASPSSWLSESVTGYFRLALVPGLEGIRAGLDRIREFL